MSSYFLYRTLHLKVGKCKIEVEFPGVVFLSVSKLSDKVTKWKNKVEV